MNLTDFFRDCASLEAAPVVVVAGAVLKILAVSETVGERCRRHCERAMYKSMPPPLSSYECRVAIAEAWAWLVANGYLCTSPDDMEGWFLITRAGKAAVAAPDFAKWTEDRLLPDELLHGALRGACLQLFRQGLFDSTVLEAFKTLEIETRRAAGLDDKHYGKALFSRAFNPEAGPLTDLEADSGERSSLLNLMIGAYGCFRNPHGHRQVGLDAAEARELLLLASHLLRIIDSRRRTP